MVGHPLAGGGMSHSQLADLMYYIYDLVDFHFEFGIGTFCLCESLFN